ncbi:MAG: phosphoglycerate kinase [Thermoproteota archaeon]|nr:phosphoglycerate kinase [Thermoproteota archaeon]MDQ3967720.1 phosphoglycerate kinase [Thermoproteota archaeon]
MRTLSDLEDSQFHGKRVFVRVDFNVSINNGCIGEDYRIRMSLPTIEYLSKLGAKVILASHLGRPEGHDQKYSIAPVAKRLTEIIGRSRPAIRFASDCVGIQIEEHIDKMNKGDILLLENLRFHKEEESNDPDFSKKLASLADIYVNDAFSTSHRKHSSTYGAAWMFDIRLAGFNLIKEVKYLSMIRENPIRPFTLVLGGVKIKDKIGALEHLLPKADKVIVGGAAAYTFLKAKGLNTGNSIIDHEHIQWVEKALFSYGDKILLPTDHLCASSPNDTSVTMVSGDIPDGMSGFDIGNETVERYSAEVGLNGGGALFWNGPMGMFEVKAFSNGTINIAKSMALAYWRGSKTLIGGGDTLEAMKRAGVAENEVSHVSTGGGATLRYLAGDDMPGLVILNNH